MNGIRHLNPATVLPPHFDRALLGYRVEPLSHDYQARAVYSIDKILEVLIDSEGMEPDAALDWFYVNIEGAHLGPSTPIYIDESADPEEDESWDE